MPIAFQCHRCGGRFSAPDQLAGKQARCQRCGAVLTVPEAAADLPLAPLDGLPGDPFAGGSPTLRPARPAGVKIPWVLILGGGGLLAFLGIGVIALVLFVQAVWPNGEGASPLRPDLLANLPTSTSSKAGTPLTTPPPARPAENPFQETPSPGTSAPSSSPPAESGGTPALPNLPNAANRRAPEPEQPPADSSPVVSWTARPDPPQARVEYKRGKISIPLPGNAELKLPHGPSHFILGHARNFPQEIWEVIDLRTGKGIGEPIKAKLDIQYNSEVFSPDGRYLAALTQRQGDETPIGIWSFISGEMVQVVRLKGWGWRVPLRFGAPHQLVSIHEPEHSRSLLTLWDLQSGQKIREIPFPEDKGENRLRPESLAVSPGGRYAAVIMGQQLGVVDLTTGDPAGTVRLPVRPSSCEGTAFSPDGGELAILASAGAGHRLFIVDFASGKLAVDHDYCGRLQYHFYDGPELDWLPDKSGLVYKGHVLLERTSGEEVWFFPATDSNPRRFIRDGEILVLLRAGGGKVLQTLDLPGKEITKAMQAVRDGGVAIDSVLPPLTTADLFSAQTQQLPNGRTQWSVSPDPAGDPPRGQDRELLVAKSGEIVRRAIFAGPPAGKVVVQKEITPPAGPGRRTQRQVVIERYDTTNGQRGDSLPVPHVYQLVEASLSGKFAVVAFAPEANKYDRLDVLGLAPKKHVAGWRPYGGEKEAPQSSSSQLRFRSLWGLPNDPRSVAWLAMIDDERLLTVNTAGKLVCWKLPECKAAYVFPDFGEPLAVSPGRKYVAGNHSGEFRVFEAATGRCVGDLEAPLLGSRAIRGAFRPDGQELTAVIDAGTDKMLVRWDLATGKLKQEIPLPAVAVSSYIPLYAAFNGMRLGLEYRGERFLMIDDQFLFDLDKRAIVWRYHLPQGHYATNSPDERTWYLIKKGRAFDEPFFLTSLDTPSLSVQQKSAGKSLEQQLVLYPGLSVRVMVDLSAAGMGDLSKTVEQSVAQGLEARGLKIDPAAALVFSVVAIQRSTGEQINVYDSRSPFGYSPFFQPAGQPKESISQEELAVRMSVSDGAGKVLWHLDRVARMRDFGSVRSGNAGQELRDEMVKNFERILAGSSSATESLPRYIFADLETILAGESQLGFHNESPPPKAGAEGGRPGPGVEPGS